MSIDQMSTTQSLGMPPGTTRQQIRQRKVEDDLANLKARLSALGSGPWLNVTFQNGWTSYPAPYGPISYRKHGDSVEMRGLMYNTSTPTPGTACFTLPAGYRPVTGFYYLFVAKAGAPGTPATCRIVVQDDGQVIWNDTSTTLGSGTGSWISLSGISFATV